MRGDHMAEDSTASTGTHVDSRTGEPKYDFVEGALIGAIVCGMLIAAMVVIDLL
jgi:hypothetical protein